MARNVFSIIHSAKPPKDTTAAQGQVCLYSGSCRDLARGNQLSHAAVATPLRDSTGCAVSEFVWWQSNSLQRANLEILQGSFVNDVKVWLWLGYFSSPDVVHCRAELKRATQRNRGNSSVSFCPILLTKVTVPFPSVATIQTSCLLLFPSHYPNLQIF